MLGTSVVRIDSESPQNVNDLVCADTTATSTELHWTTLATDAHFKSYEIYEINGAKYKKGDSIN